MSLHLSLNKGLMLFIALILLIPLIWLEIVREELVAGLLEWSLSCLILMEFKAWSRSKANAKFRD
ncbi:MAG: hypothetical protein LZ163_06370, partial [Thaumarchaeota archaeon]|nr:hypothetical protein [Candidatus Terraquivivens yellowstonensis]